MLSFDSIGYFGRWDYGEWKEMLLEGGVGEVDEAIRRATRTGELLGSRDFVAGLERRAGKRLRVLAAGPSGWRNRERSVPVRATSFREEAE